jgi:hypothetical protein
MSAPVLTIHRPHGVVSIGIDYGYGEKFSASFPTGEQAAYPEAIESNRVECEREVAEYVAGYRERFPDLIVQDPHKP